MNTLENQQGNIRVLSSYQDNTPKLWLELKENDPYAIVKFSADDIKLVYTKLKQREENTPFGLDDVLAMWAVHRLVQREMSPQEILDFISSGNNVVDISGKKVKAVFRKFPMGELRLGKDYKMHDCDGIAVVVPWGMDGTEVRRRVMGWTDARTLRIRAFKKQQYRKTYKMLALDRLLTPWSIASLWCDCEHCKEGKTLCGFLREKDFSASLKEVKECALGLESERT